ncbi:MAG: hypothetical protein KatS3mg105_4140 [Gemmatales bacterium]|nr:MAG: hypothetical protein KatS3mg105_4140 [Gemmatales bacterium]
MSWPLSQDYNEAVQDPASCFADPDLKQGETVCNAMGIPQPCSGNFADVYAVNTPKGKWAVKCFTRQIPGLKERYKEISAYLKEQNLPFMVQFEFQEQGVKVNGSWYPILKMEWVEGFALNTFIKDNLNKTNVLIMMCQIWQRMADRLREAELAHCDLQHGNVMLVPGTRAGTLGVKLVDYDGMCVPALSLLKPIEVGHPNYQHPERLKAGKYGLEIDRFCHLVIYTAFRALIADRTLWQKYDNGDNLLFKQQDFVAPNKSPLFRDLLQSKDAAVPMLARAILDALKKPLEEAPLLSELVPALPPLPTAKKVSTLVKPAGNDAFAGVGEATIASRSARRRQGSKRNLLTISIAAGAACFLIVAAMLMYAFNKGGDSKDQHAKVDQIDHSSKTRPRTPPEKKTDENNKTSKTKTDNGKPPSVLPEPKPGPDPEPKPRPKPRGEEAFLVELTSPASQVDISDDGRRALVAHGNQVEVWDIATRKKLADIRSPNQEMAMAATFLPGGKEALLSFRGLPTALVKVDSGTTMGQLKNSGAGTEARQIRVSHDGRRAVTAHGTGKGDGMARVWDVTTGNLLAETDKQILDVIDVAISADAKRVLLKMQNVLAIWDVDKGKQIRRLSIPASIRSSATVQAMLTFDGRRVLFPLNGGICHWDAEADRQIKLVNTVTNADFVAITRDGRHALIRNDTMLNQFVLVDAESGQTLKTFSGHTEAILYLGFAQFGQYAVSTSQDKSLRLWSLPQTVAFNVPVLPQAKPQVEIVDKEFARVDCNASVGKFDVSPDGRLAAIIVNSQVEIWDFASGKLLRTIRDPKKYPPYSAVFLPDSRHLLVGFRLSRISVVDVKTGQIARQFAMPKDNPTAIALVLSYDGRRLAALHYEAKQDTIRLWDVPSGRLLKETTTSDRHVTFLSLSGKGQCLAWRDRQGWWFWDTDGNDPPRQIQFSQSVVTHCELSPDGDKLFFLERSKNPRLVDFVCWDTKTEREISRVTLEGFCVGLVLSRDGRYGLTTRTIDNQNTLVMFDPRTGKDIRHYRGLLPNPATPRIIGADQFVACNLTKTVCLWKLDGSKTIDPQPTPEPMPQKEIARINFGDTVRGMLVSNDMIFVYTLSRFEAYALKTGRQVKTYQQGDLKIVRAALLPNQSLAVVATPSQIGVLDLETGRIDRRFEDVSPGSVYVLTVSQDGKRAVVVQPNLRAAPQDRTRKRYLLTAWDIPSGRRIASYDEMQWYSGNLIVAEDGKCAVFFGGAAGMPRTVVRWEINGDGKLIQSTLRTEIRSGMILPGGKAALLTMTDGQTVLWDFATGEEKSLPRLDWQGKQWIISQLAPCPDRKTIIASGASGGNQFAVLLIDFANWRVLQSFDCANCRSVGVSPDGRYAVAATIDNTISVYRLPEQIAKATRLPDPVSPSKPEPKPAPVDSRLAIPDTDEQKKALGQLRDLFAQDYAKSDANSVLALAQKLLAVGLDKTNSIAERFVSFSEACNLALKAAEIELAFSIIDAQAREFRIDAQAEKKKHLEEAAKTVPFKQAPAVVEGFIALSSKAAEADDYDSALACLQSGEALANKYQLVNSSVEVRRRMNALKELQKAFANVRKALAKLKSEPDDADANRTVGEYLGFDKFDWEKALPYLAKGADDDLKKLVEQERAGVEKAEEQVSLADAYYQLATKKTGNQRRALYRRAYHWYQIAYEKLEGISQDRVAKRLGDIEKMKSVLPPGLARTIKAPSKAMRLLLSPASKNVVIACLPNALCTIDVRSSELKVISRISTFRMKDIQLSPNGKRLLVNFGGQTNLYDLDADPNRALSLAADLRFFLNETTLFYLSSNGLRLSRLTNTNSLLTQTAFQGQVLGSSHQLTVSADRRYAYISSDLELIQVYSVLERREVTRLKSPAGKIHALASAPNGRYLAVVGDKDNGIYLIDVAKKQVLRQYRGHIGKVNRLAFSPDGLFVLSAGSDGTIRLWSLKSNSELHRFVGHEGAVNDVAFLPDGRRFASAGEDQTVRLWRLP